MVKILKKLYNKTLKKMRLAWLLVSHKDSYLVQTGYIHSIMKKSLKTSKNEYIPWMNYPVIEFLKERLTSDLLVFEYGSGASTIFFAKRVKKIISVEYDKEWYEKVKIILSEENTNNAKLLFQKLTPNYPLAIKNLGKNQAFDIVIIDGRERVKCAQTALKFLSQKGVLIFDDSYRKEYKLGIDYYLNLGFKKLTFKGLKPTSFGTGETVILYKSENCLNI